MKRSPIKRRNPARASREFARCFGSRERVLWVKAQPCRCCQHLGMEQTTPTDNAHAGGNAGAHRRGPYTEIVPLCRTHHDELDGRTGGGNRQTFEAKYGVQLSRWARETDTRWLEASCPDLTF